MDDYSQVPVVLQKLPTTVRAFTTLGVDYEPVIVINSALPLEMQRTAYRHEIAHLASGQFWDERYREYGA